MRGLGEGKAIMKRLVFSVFTLVILTSFLLKAQDCGKEQIEGLNEACVDVNGEITDIFKGDVTDPEMYPYLKLFLQETIDGFDLETLENTPSFYLEVSRISFKVNDNWELDMTVRLNAYQSSLRTHFDLPNLDIMRSDVTMDCNQSESTLECGAILQARESILRYVYDKLENLESPDLQKQQYVKCAIKKIMDFKEQIRPIVEQFFHPVG